MSNPLFLVHADLQELIDAIAVAGYEVMGPRLRDGAIVYDTMTKVETLPRGVQDAQAPGSYNLQENGSSRYFAWANGPQALKPICFKPREILWRAHKGDDGAFEFVAVEPEHKKQAVLGVRSCDIAALFIHDKHFMQDDYRDDNYLANRQGLFLIAVHCTHPADTCFCASTGDGPRATFGYDMAMSEIDGGFLIETRTEHAQEIVASLDLMPATAEQVAAADAEIECARVRQSRAIPSHNLSEELFAKLEHGRWDAIAERCLSCGNCTMVCPTCFCHQQGDEISLDGSVNAHYREWDSCFTANHSYIHGMTIRADTRLRYRQWMTHKFASWHEQYGRSGCVGCGRCISWCPVGIDVTEEINAICTEGNHV
jgi:ferredoxin